ncbi:MAG: 4Fe-4S dicluster domain-containing protein [Desulfovibrio sp.]|nr:4Fe-4S dicluster domain-containing protein [Desulfovibrio sp.]
MQQNPRHIFKLAKEGYSGNEPKANGEFDPCYALFDRYEPRPGRSELAFFTDTSICSGCKSCEIACKQWNQLRIDGIEWSGDSYDNTRDLSANNWRHVKFIERFPRKNNLDRPAPKTIPGLLAERKNGEWLFQSDQCKHCQESPCHEACPTGAIMRNEYGGIYYQTDICMGCRMCIASCPFGVPALSAETGHSMKCAECYDRLRDGLTPACQLACPTGAIQFGLRDEMLNLANERLAFLQGHGHPKARLYGATPFNDYPALNSFYLLMDEPEIYGLPAEPVLPVRRMLGDYFRAVITLAICGAAIAACL